MSSVPSSEAPLTFGYSESKPEGSWLNKSRFIGITRIASSLTLGASGFTTHNRWRLASAVLGLYASTIHFLWGETSAGKTRLLELHAGAWQQQNGFMVQTLPHAGKDALSGIEQVLKDGEFPPSILRTENAGDGLTLRVKREDFPALQHYLHGRLVLRAQAYAILAEEERAHYSPDDKTKLQRLSLNRVDERVVQEMGRILETEWHVPAYLTQDVEGRWLNAVPDAQKTFAKARLQPNINLASFTVAPAAEQAAGFWEAILRPDKFPVQSSTIVGGLMANLMRIIGSIEGDPGKSPAQTENELYRAIFSQLSAIFESAREIDRKPQRPPVVQGATGEHAPDAFDRGIAYLNAHPMASSLPIRAGMLLFGFKDAAANPDDKYKLINTWLDTVLTGVSATVRKRDYGR